ncbi:MAG: hypothetical protein R3C11_16505 [Planctomycetaceae bacterium]
MQLPPLTEDYEALERGTEVSLAAYESASEFHQEAAPVAEFDVQETRELSTAFQPRFQSRTSSTSVEEIPADEFELPSIKR